MTVHHQTLLAALKAAKPLTYEAARQIGIRVASEAGMDGRVVQSCADWFDRHGAEVVQKINGGKL